MNTGSILMGRPSLGSWVAYGLGTESQNMPAYVVLPDPAGWVKGGAPAWGNGYLPAAYQGTVCAAARRRSATCIRRPASPPQQQRPHARLRQSPQSGTSAQPRRMTASCPPASPPTNWLSACKPHAPEVVDTASETQATRRLYGLDRPQTAEFGLRCLLARRMVERGVRFVQVYCGDTNGWDGHAEVDGNHARLCGQSDLPIAGLLRDLKSRGLLDSTLVIWGGEFGRTPMTEGSTGRDHNPHGFSMWLAGGGVKGGQVIGSTDAVGLRAAEDVAHVHDIHATILHLLGLDHERLTYRHNGRDERLTDVRGVVIERVWH